MKIEIKNTNCPICNNIMSHLFNAKQLDSDDEIYFPILNCHNCNHSITLTGDSNINDIYKTGNYDKKENIWHKITRPFLILLEKNKLRYFSSKKQVNGHLLEVGCGKGKFLKIAQDIGYQIIGLEPSSRSFNFAIDELPGKILPKTITEAYDDGDLSQKYVAIVLWHVLEHINDIHSTMHILKKILSDEGKIILAVPNNSSIQSIFGRGNWFHLDPPRHLHHFSPNSIKLLADKFDLTIDKIYYNSFYQNFIGELFTFTNIIFPYKNFLLNSLKSNPIRPNKSKHKTIFATLLVILITIVAFIPILIFTIVINFFQKSGTMVVIAKHKLGAETP